MRNPCLRNLLKFLTLPIHNDKQKIRTTIQALDLYGQSPPHSTTIDPRDLEIHLTKGLVGKHELQGRVLIVEDPSADTVETVGSCLNIDPLFFASHLYAPAPDVHSQTPQAAILPSQLKGQGFIAHTYHRVLKFDAIPPSADLILVDPPVTDQYILENRASGTRRQITIPTDLFQGGYQDFRPSPPLQDEASWRTKPLKAGMADDLINYWSLSLPPQMETARPSVLSIAYYPLRIIAAEWIKYVEIMRQSVKQYEYQINNIPNLAKMLERFDSDLKALQSWRRRTISTRHKLDSIIHFVTMARHGSVDDETADLLLRDYRHLEAAVARHGQLLEMMLPVLTSLVQVVDSRRSFIETANISRLTYLALAFVPLSFISSVFSMSADFAPDGNKFWVYFVVAIPLMMLVFALARLPVAELNLFWASLRKRRGGIKVSVGV
ncbi:MAG: hypothetical protein LQ340_007059 [Diploschistes diacapsis]|nr:MAG: hypothetical protein LQ340_007059 [Diploschistes diacapsis]